MPPQAVQVPFFYLVGLYVGWQFIHRNSRNGGMVKRRNGRMAERRNGVTAELVERLILAEWRDGRNRYLPTSFMVHANEDTDTFKSFIVQANRSFGTYSCHDVCFSFVSFVFILLS